jgi:membrane fusion protein (multidrug efflux system)
VVGGGIGGFLYYRYTSTHISTDDAFLQAHIVPVSARVNGSVGAVLVDDNQRVRAGDVLVRLDPSDFETALQGSKAQLAAAQHAAASAALEADLIAQQTTARLAQAQAGIEEATAARQTAEAVIEQAAQRVTLAEAQAATAAAELAHAAAEAKAKQADADRDADVLRHTREAYGNGAATQRELDDATYIAAASAADAEAAQRTTAAAESRVAAAAASVELARRDLQAARSSAEEAQAAVSAAQARLAEAKTGEVASRAAEARAGQGEAEVQRLQAVVKQNELNLSYTTIAAPFDGRVTSKAVEPGQNVAVGQALLAVVSENVWVKANYKETHVGRIRVGMLVDIEVDAYPDASFTGRVQSVQSGTGAVFSLLPPENATGNYVKVVQRVPVKIVFDPMPDTSDHILVPGMSVVPKVLVNSPRLAAGDIPTPTPAAVAAP